MLPKRKFNVRRSQSHLLAKTKLLKRNHQGTYSWNHLKHNRAMDAGNWRLKEKKIHEKDHEEKEKEKEKEKRIEKAAMLDAQNEQEQILAMRDLIRIAERCYKHLQLEEDEDNEDEHSEDDTTTNLSVFANALF